MPQPQQKASLELLRRARAHCLHDPDIQVDYDAIVQRVDDEHGHWVQAWIWVKDEPVLEDKPLDKNQTIVLRYMDDIKAGAIYLPRPGLHGVWVWADDVRNDPALALEIARMPNVSLKLAEALAG